MPSQKYILTACTPKSIGGDLGGGRRDGPPRREVEGTELLIPLQYFVNIDMLIV